MDALWRYAVDLCLTMGDPYAPRQMRVLEVPYPVVLRLRDVHAPFITSPTRRPNYMFGLAEASWILGGLKDAGVISDYNRQMLRFSDDNKSLWGAYGPRLMGQLSHVISTLGRDPDSRQAVVTTWRPMVGPCSDARPGTFLEAAGVSSHREGPEWDGSSWRSRDVPCTVAWHFQVRDDRLNLTVFMRSNDVWLGMPYDILSFTTVQRVVASVLGVVPGEYVHIASNLHLYEKNLDAAKMVAEEVPPIAVPRVPTFGGLFYRWPVSRIADLFGQDIMQSKLESLKTVKPIQPFIAAARKDTSLWDQWQILMAANGRSRPADK